MPGPEVELAAQMVRLYIAEVSAEEEVCRLPTAAEQLAIDIVDKWTYGPYLPRRAALRLVKGA